MSYQTRQESIRETLLTIMPPWPYDIVLMVMNYMKHQDIYILSPNGQSFYRITGDCFDTSEKLESQPTHLNYCVKTRSMYQSSNNDIHLMSRRGVYHRFDHSSQTWITTPTVLNCSSPAIYRWSAVSVIVKHNTYLIGGEKLINGYFRATPTNSIDIFDNITQKWSVNTYFIRNDSSTKHTAVVIDSLIYIFNCEDQGEVIDISSMSDSSYTMKFVHYTPNLLFGDLTYPLAVVINPQQVLIFGSNKKEVLDYNPETNTLVISKTIEWNIKRRQYSIYKIWFDPFTNSLFAYASSSKIMHCYIYSCVLPSSPLVSTTTTPTTLSDIPSDIPNDIPNDINPCGMVVWIQRYGILNL
jgi:hypothetical protein